MYRRNRDPDEDSVAEGHSQAVERGQLHATEAARNANYGSNYGMIYQHNVNTTIRHDLLPSDIASLLNPILDASHTRNLLHSPPHSECLEGTRVEIIAKVLAWARSGIQDSDDHTHILWIYGYAGCGKSAISLAVSRQLADEDLLAASFFFLRGAGDRGRALRVMATIVCQMAAAVPAISTFVEDAIKWKPSLLSLRSTNLGDQFRELVFKPILKAAASLNFNPVTIVLDGIDECEDHEDIRRFVGDMIKCFDKYPLAPLRVVISSRVEGRLHGLLYGSRQVYLLDLVSHTSDRDILTAIEACVEKERSGGPLRFEGSWPSTGEKQQLVQTIGGSFIFMTTVLRELFKPITYDGKTPMDRLPSLLSSAPNFDDLYKRFLAPLDRVPHFLDITSTIALAERALSIAEIADLVEIRVASVSGVLLSLQAIIRVPQDECSPVTIWHTSLRSFLCSEERAGPFFASPAQYGRLTCRAVQIVASSATTLSPAFDYAYSWGMRHLRNYLLLVNDGTSSYDTLLGNIMPDLAKATFKDGETLFYAAFLKEKPDWELVRALVNAGADVNARFPSRWGPSVALHFACYRNAKEMIDFLLENGADPNVLTSHSFVSVYTRTIIGTSLYGLMAQVDPNKWDWEYSSFPLAWAAARGDVQLVRKLLAYDADPNLKGGKHGSAFHCAFLKDSDTSHEIVRILLESGGDPHITGGNAPSTPLIS